MRLFVTFLALLCLGNSFVYAQRSRSRYHAKKEKISVDSLIKTYRFVEAVEQLEKDIAYAERRRRSTDELEAKLERVHSLEVMLSATEKVKFIDSLVVDKENFLTAFRLGADCGKLASPQSLLPENLSTLQGLGRVAYRNQLNDKIYFSINKEVGMSGLYSTSKIGDSWSKAKPLKGISSDSVVQDCPYVLSDGVTLYYSEKSDEGLGGYDIYVTRYNPDSDSYLKPENIGMPFNSMANDYLYVIDEMNNLGWFATDRNQPEDKVCIYVFQPNVTRDVYNPIIMGEEMMRRLAMITSINDSRLDKRSLEQARARLEQVQTEPVAQNFGEKLRYVIDDHKVYNSLLEFQSEEAQGFAMEWAKEYQKLKAAEKELDLLRHSYQSEVASAEEKNRLTLLEAEVFNLRNSVTLLAKKMRAAELK